MKRASRCPCGQLLVDGRCGACDAVRDSLRAASRDRQRRREEARAAQRAPIDPIAVREAARRVNPEEASYAEAASWRTRRGWLTRRAGRMGTRP